MLPRPATWPSLRRLARLLDGRSLPPDAADSLAVTLASITQAETLERQIGEAITYYPD